MIVDILEIKDRIGELETLFPNVFNIGYLSLLINIPLLLICYFKISHLFSIRTLFFFFFFFLL